MVRDLVRRKLRVSVSITSYGTPGVIKAIGKIFSKSIRMRFWAYKMRNLSSKVLESEWPEIKVEIREMEGMRKELGIEEGKNGDRKQSMTKKKHSIFTGKIGLDPKKNH